MLVSKGQSQTLPVQGKSINGIDFKAKLTHNNVATAFNGDEVNWQKASVKCVLNRNGKQITIVEGQLLPLLRASNFNNSSYAVLKGADYDELVTQGAAEYNVILLNARLEFGETIVLKGGDMMTIYVTVGEDFFAGTVNPSLSQLEFLPVDSIGEEVAIPVIQLEPINSETGTFSKSFGEMVKEVFFVHLGTEESILEEDSILKHVSLSSDKIKFVDFYSTLLMKRKNQFASLSQEKDRFQDFKILDAGGVPCNNVNVELTLNIGNVEANQNFVVVRGLVSDPETYRRGIERIQKHHKENMTQLAG